LAVAVPRAARTATGGGALRVLCPGVIPSSAEERGCAPGAWDLRCHTALPASLIGPFLPPPSAAPAGGAAGLQRARSATRRRFDDACTQLYLHLRTRACPWCGARCQLASGCDAVQCAACTHKWCFGCGSRTPETCTHFTAPEGDDPVSRAVRWARDAPAREVRALRWLLVALAGVCALPFIAAWAAWLLLSFLVVMAACALTVVGCAAVVVGPPVYLALKLASFALATISPTVCALRAR
jgi:hypothetical protein